MATKAERKKRLVARLEALLESDNDTLMAYAQKLVNEHDVCIGPSIKPLPWIRARISERLEEARRWPYLSERKRR